MSTTDEQRLREALEELLHFIPAQEETARALLKDRLDLLASQAEAAPAGEPVAWRVRGYSQFKTGTPSPWKYVDGPRRPDVNTPEDCDFEPVYAAQPAPPKPAKSDESSDARLRADGDLDAAVAKFIACWSDGSSCAADELEWQLDNLFDLARNRVESSGLQVHTKYDYDQMLAYGDDCVRRAIATQAAKSDEPARDAAAPVEDAEGCTPADVRVLRAANTALAQESHELQDALADLYSQVKKFCEEQGEADFETGRALWLLAKLRHVDAAIDAAMQRQQGTTS